MSTFQQQLYAVENAARKNITDKLDEVTEVILFDITAEHDIDDENFSELPTQSYEGKHETIYYYKIIKVYKEDGHYFAHGVDEDNKLQYYDFNLFESLDATVLAEIADLLNN